MTPRLPGRADRDGRRRTPLWRTGGRAGLWTPSWPPRAVFSVGTWVWAGVFTLRAVGDFRLVGFFKRPSDSRFARRDTRLYSPLCLALGLALLALALR